MKWTKWLGLVLVTLALPVAAQVAHQASPELGRIDIVEHLGESIPLDLKFVDDHGDSVTLEKYFGNDKPVVMVLGYYRCPMLCNLVFNGVVDGINELDLNPGEQFQIVTVSINPEETPDLASAKKENYLGTINREIDPDGWSFLVGAADQSEALAEAIGFHYFYDTERDEYAHAAAAYVLTPEGELSRYLYGIQFTKTDLKLSLLEASEGRIGNPFDKLLLYCYQYDPDARGYAVVAGNVMKLGGSATVLALGLLLSLLWYGERSRRRSRQAAADSANSEAKG